MVPNMVLIPEKSWHNFSASCCSVENGSQHGLDPRVTIWHNKKYFMLDVYMFCSVGSQHGLDPRVTILT